MDLRFYFSRFLIEECSKRNTLVLRIYVFFKKHFLVHINVHFHDDIHGMYSFKAINSIKSIMHHLL